MRDINLRSALYGACPSILRLYWDRVEASEIGSRLALGAFWLMCGALVSQGLMLAASILVARMLGREVYGEFGIIRSTINTFVVFAGFGMGVTATKHVAEFRDTDPSRAGRIMAFSGLFAMATGSLIAVVLSIFAPWLSVHSINAPHLASELRIGAIVLLINAFNGAQTGALAGLEAFKTIARVNLMVGLFSFPLLVSGAYLGGLRGAVWALGANMAINGLMNHFALRKEATKYKIPFTFKGCIQERSILWKFSLPAVLAGIMVGPVLWVCNAILVNQPGGYSQMGLFDAANQWGIIILFIPGLVGQIALPILASLNDPNDQTKYRKVLLYNAILNGCAALALALPIALFSRWIMKSYGKGFEQGQWTLVCLAFTSVLVAVNSAVGQAIASKGRMWNGFLLNALWAVALLTFSLILIRNGYGAIGLAFAYLTAYILHCLWVSLYVYIKIFMFIKK